MFYSRFFNKCKTDITADRKEKSERSIIINEVKMQIFKLKMFTREMFIKKVYTEYRTLMKIHLVSLMSHDRVLKYASKMDKNVYVLVREATRVERDEKGT